jgi:hypothetical protein
MIPAVAVGESVGLPSVVLDEEDRVVEVGPHAPAIVKSLLGERAQDIFPETEALYRPYYARARRTGAVVEFAQYSNGHVSLIKIVPARRRLTVSWELIGFIDVMTLEGLQASLAAALDALVQAEALVRRNRVRGSLRVVAGTG